MVFRHHGLWEELFPVVSIDSEVPGHHTVQEQRCAWTDSCRNSVPGTLENGLYGQFDILGIWYGQNGKQLLGCGEIAKWYCRSFGGGRKSGTAIREHGKHLLHSVCSSALWVFSCPSPVRQDETLFLSDLDWNWIKLDRVGMERSGAGRGGAEASWYWPALARPPLDGIVRFDEAASSLSSISSTFTTKARWHFCTNFA